MFFVMLLSSCQKSDFELAQQEVIDEMGWLYKADPAEDVEDAINREDYRFRGIYGYSISVPGVDTSCWSITKNVSPILGTSDAVIGYEHSKLIAIARAYARTYNFLMLIHLEQEHNFKCGEKMEIWKSN